MAELTPLLTLTEEELDVLTEGRPGPVPPQVLPLGESVDTDLARTVALRSLLARGLVVPLDGVIAVRSPDEAGAVQGGGALGEWTGVRWEAAEPLGLLLELRDAAPTVLGVRRLVGALQDSAEPAAGPTTATRYLHLLPGVGVVEDVTPEGMHALMVVLPEDWPHALSQFLLPPDAVPGTGPPRQVATSDDSAGADASGPRRMPDHAGAREATLLPDVPALLASLGHPTVMADLELLRPDTPEPQRRTLALGPGGCFSCQERGRFVPVDPAGLPADLVQWASLGLDQLAEAESSPVDEQVTMEG